MNNEASRIYGYTFISEANSMSFCQKFTLSRAARADSNAQNTLFKVCPCLFLSPKKAFRSFLRIFKSALAIWLRSLTVDISYVPRIGEIKGLITMKTGNHLTFIGMPQVKSFDNVNVTGEI